VLVLFSVAVGLEGPARAAEPVPAKAHDGAPAPSQYSVKNISAYPWCHGKGKVGDQDFLTKKFVTRNVPFSSPGEVLEGDVECPASITLVVAEIRQPPEDGRKPATLTLTAKSSGRLLAHQTFHGNFFPHDFTTIYLPMLIFGTGCELVEVEAKASIGKKVVGSMKKTIEFYCGE